MEINLSETDKAILARHSSGVRGRALIELQVVDALIKAAQDIAYHLEIRDEEATPHSSTRTGDSERFKDLLFELDDAVIDVIRAPEQEPFGWIRLVFGNSGWDLVSDYSVNLEEFLGPVNAVADFWGQQEDAMTTATDTAETWAIYERQYGRCRDRMEKSIRDVAEELHSEGVWVETLESSGEEYGWTLFAVPAGGEMEDGVDMDFTIWDSGDADDGIYGEHGNFHSGITRYGGEMLGAMVPYNYTEDVWVDYGDDAEWDRRLAMMEEAIADGAAHTILKALGQ